MSATREMSESQRYAEALKGVSRRNEQLVQVLSILREMDQLDDPASELKVVCCRVVEAIASSLAAENCSLFLRNGDLLELRATCSPFEEGSRFFDSETWTGRKFRIGEGIAGTVAKIAAPVRVEDTYSDSRFVTQAQGKVAVGSMLCFPMLVDRRVVGVLNMSHSEMGFFTAENEYTMSFVADRAARMLANHVIHERIRQSEAHYRLVMENAADAILVFGADGRIVNANPAAGRLSGVPLRDFLTNKVKWESRVHPDDWDLFRAHQKQLIDTRSPGVIQYRCIDTDSNVHLLEQRSAPFLDSAGELLGIVAVARDVSEQKMP